MIYIRKKKTIHTFFSCFMLFQCHHIELVVGCQSWPFYIGSKRGKLQARPDMPVLHPFPGRWRGLENALIRFRSDTPWWLQFCTAFDGKAPVIDTRIMIHMPLATDSSVTGFGAVWSEDYVVGS